MSNIKFSFFFFFLLLPVLFLSFFSFHKNSLSAKKRELISCSSDSKNTLWKITHEIPQGQKDGRDWLWLILFGLLKIKFKNGDKDIVYHFDELAPTLRNEINKQKKDHLMKIEFTKISGKACEQIGQVYKKGKKIMPEGTGMHYYAKWERYEYWTNFFLKPIIPLLLKMQVLGLTKLEFDVKVFPSTISTITNGFSNSSGKSRLGSKKVQSDTSPQKLNINSYSPCKGEFLCTKKILDIKDLVRFPDLANISWKKMYKKYSKERLPSSGFEKITPIFEKLVFHFNVNDNKLVINDNINHYATPWLKVLQKADFLGLSYLNVGQTKVDVSTLVSSQVQEASALSLADLKIIKNLKPLTLSKLQTQVQTWIDTTLDSYKKSIQSTLENLVNTKITQIKINGTIYQVDLLLKNTNLQLSGSQLPEDAKNQLSALIKTKITPQTLEDALEDAKLEIYHSTLLGYLNALQKQNISELQIKGKTHSLTEITKPINNDKTFQHLSSTAKNELLALRRANIGFQELIQALRDVLLETYRLTIVNNINALRDKNVSEIQINGTTYAITELIKPINKNKTVYILSPATKTELKVLFKNHITKTQLDTVLTEILASREAASKERKMKHIKIGLAASGVALALSALGAFLYWSLKVKK